MALKMQTCVIYEGISLVITINPWTIKQNYNIWE